MGVVEVNEDSGDETVEFQLGNTPGWSQQALHAAFWTYCQSLSLIVDEFRPQVQDDFRERCRAGEQAFSRADHWESVGAFEDPFLASRCDE